MYLKTAAFTLNALRECDRTAHFRWRRRGIVFKIQTEDGSPRIKIGPLSTTRWLRNLRYNLPKSFLDQGC